MRFSTLYDANSEAGLDKVFDSFDDGGFEDFFENKFYDDSGIKITVVFMCRDTQLNLKQRIRFSKAENKLYVDLMLNLEAMRISSTDLRKRLVAKALLTELPPILEKYNFRDFDLKRFKSDLYEWFQQHAWLE